MTAWDRSAIVLLGAAGFAFSYDALRQIAVAIHAQESLSYLFPVFIDGFIAYGVRAIVLLRHERFSARLYAWVLFLAATSASLGANALHAVTLNRGPLAGRSALHLADSVVAGLSTLAPLALAGSVHLYILMARTTERAVRDQDDAGPGPVREQPPTLEQGAVHPASRRLEASMPVFARSLHGAPSAAHEAAATADHSGLQPNEEPRAEGAVPSSSVEADDDVAGSANADGPDAGRAEHTPSAAVPATATTSISSGVSGLTDDMGLSVRDGADHPQDRVADDDWLAELLPIGRAAAERAGRTSREVVGDAVRKHRAISNDRLGVLLARLKEEDDESATAPTSASRPLW